LGSVICPGTGAGGLDRCGSPVSRGPGAGCSSRGWWPAAAGLGERGPPWPWNCVLGPFSRDCGALWGRVALDRRRGPRLCQGSKPLKPCDERAQGHTPHPLGCSPRFAPYRGCEIAVACPQTRLRGLVVARRPSAATHRRMRMRSLSSTSVMVSPQTVPRRRRRRPFAIDRM